MAVIDISGFAPNSITDGPGLRFSVFCQGCVHHCPGCHNPETQELSGGTKFSSDEIIEKAIRYKEYFGKDGGITVSGGEPLLQSEFVTELFSLCHGVGINTCLDTSGSVMNDSVRSLLEETDRVLLDIKYTDEEKYRKYVGCGINKPMEFLSYLNEKKIPVTLRQVIIPELNGDEENIKRLRKIAEEHGSVDKTELLPFKKICQVKYEKMGIDFPFADCETPDRDLMQRLNDLMKD